MDEHVWIPAILVNKRVPWSAHGQPALLRFRCTLREADSSQSPKSEWSGDQFLHGGRARLGSLGFFGSLGDGPFGVHELDMSSKRLQPSFCWDPISIILDILGARGWGWRRGAVAMETTHLPTGFSGSNSGMGHGHPLLRAKSSMTFSEYRERLNPLVNHDYLILSAFQWP